MIDKHFSKATLTKIGNSFPDKANLLVREGRKAADLNPTKTCKMAELPKDIVPYGGVGLFVSPFNHIQKEVISKEELKTLEDTELF